MAVFRESLAIWETGEVRSLVEKLQGKLPKPSLSQARKAEAELRYDEAVAQYREALKWGEYTEAIDRLGICLIKQGNYLEAADILTASSTDSPEVHYYAGYALAKAGHYGRAIRQWDKIKGDSPDLAQQKHTLMSLAVHDLLEKSKNIKEFESAYQDALDLLAVCPIPIVRNCVMHMKFHHLEDLWARGKHAAILDFLHTCEARGDMEEFFPLVMAKMYYQLGEKDITYLLQAIPLWLTVIHNKKYHFPLSSKSIGEGPPEKDNALTQDLEQRFSQLVNLYKTQAEDDLLEELLALWETEQEAILFLAEIAEKDEALKEVICTPGFAERFSLSDRIVERLDALVPSWGENEGFWKVGSLFSMARQSCLLLKNNRIEEALAALPAKSENIFVEYTRQKLFFVKGKEKLKQGEVEAKKYFSQALPLVKKFPKYEEELVTLVHEIDHDSKLLICADQVLQSILRSHRSEALLKITSYIMNYKAQALYDEGVIKAADAERICKKALELFPENEHVKTSLKELQSKYQFEELDRAFYKGNIKRAASVVLEAGNLKVEEAFFDFVESAIDNLDESSLNTKEKAAFLGDAYNQCEKIDPAHPILDTILDELEALDEEEV